MPDRDLHQIAARIEGLLAGRSLDGWELYLLASRRLNVEVRAGEVDAFKSAAPSGVSVRLLKEGGLGFAYSTSLEEADLQRMLECALVGAASQTPDPWHAFPSPAPLPQLAGMEDAGLAGVATETKVALAKELERLTLAADPRIRQVRKASFAESRYQVLLRNSNGVAAGYRGTSVSASVTAIAAADDDTQMGGDFRFGIGLADLDLGAIASGAAARATGLLGARSIPGSRCPVVLDNYVATELLEVLAASFLAEQVQKGKSLLAGKRGERLFAPCLQIVDDGLLAGGMGTAPCDGEGVPQQRTILVEDGVLQGYLYDGYTARKEGCRSTGNASRGGVKSVPGMGVTNLAILPGSGSQADLLRQLERGVLLTEVIGMHTANPVSGDFSVGASGYLVERGEIVHPVKGIAVAGNLLELFAQVAAVADDLRYYGAVGAPALLVPALDISGS